MAQTPAVDETRKERRWQWMVGTGAVIFMFSVAGNVALSFQSIANQRQIGHLLSDHTATRAQQQKQAQQGRVFLKDLGLFATYVIKSDEAICAAIHTQCPPVPKFTEIPK